MVVQLRGGYGDQLWAARFIPAEAARVPHLTVVMHTALLRLCRSSFATVTCVDHWPGTIALPDPDMGDAGDGAPYLRVAAPSSVLDGLHVGVCWCASGGPTDGRSVPLGALAEPLLAVPGLTLHALQQGRCTTDLSAFPDIRTYSFADFHDTAALAVTLDAVVCVDTSVAHCGRARRAGSGRSAALGPRPPLREHARVDVPHAGRLGDAVRSSGGDDRGRRSAAATGDVTHEANFLRSSQELSAGEHYGDGGTRSQGRTHSRRRDAGRDCAAVGGHGRHDFQGDSWLAAERAGRARDCSGVGRGRRRRLPAVPARDAGVVMETSVHSSAPVEWLSRRGRQWQSRQAADDAYWSAASSEARAIYEGFRRARTEQSAHVAAVWATQFSVFLFDIRHHLTRRAP